MIPRGVAKLVGTTGRLRRSKRDVDLVGLSRLRPVCVGVRNAAPLPGGMLRMGIPPYRLPREIIDCEVDFIEHLGVEIRYGFEVGRDASFSDLVRDHDAVFLGCGCRKGRGAHEACLSGGGGVWRERGGGGLRAGGDPARSQLESTLQ